MTLAPRLTANWLQWRSTRKLMASLQAAGGQAWFVGGCVRDSLLDPALDDARLDIDIATDLLPENVVAAVQAAGMKAVPTGIAHGTVTVVVGGRPFEVTTLRRDVATDGRHAEVAFSDSLVQDAARRDFTINALYAQADGLIVDPLRGLDDLARRRVRFVGDPDRRILEDHLRILRFFRFFARFGDGRPDPEGFAACVRHRDRLQGLSAERIAKEFLKLLMAPNGVTSLRAMQEGGILAALGLGRADPAGLAALLALGQRTDPLLRLAALFRGLEPAPGQGSSLAKDLKLSARERERLEAMLGQALPPLQEDRIGRCHRWYREGVPAWRDRFLLRAALAGAGVAEIAAPLDEAAAYRRPRFPLGGQDVLALGVAPGPGIGTLLHAVEAWWLDQEARPDRDACLHELEARFRLDEPAPDP